MIILGIDPGTARMGYAVLKAHKTRPPKILDTDTIITKPTLEMPERLWFLYSKLHSVIKLHTPNVVVIEKLFFNNNAKTAMAVGQARGVTLLSVANRDILLCEYTALEAKKVLTGDGRASKKQVQDAVKEILKLDHIVKSDDANDAVAIALCYLKKAHSS